MTVAFNTLFRNTLFRVEEIAWGFRAFLVLAENPTSLPSTHILWWLTVICTFSFGRSDGLRGNRNTFAAQHPYWQNSKTQNKNKGKNLKTYIFKQYFKTILSKKQRQLHQNTIAAVYQILFKACWIQF